MRSCPNCSQVMVEVQFPGRLRQTNTGELIQVIIDECKSCNGFWFDRYEAEATIGLRDKLHLYLEFSPPTAASGAACPGCQTPLEAMKLKDTQIDACPACGGFWMSHDALTSLPAALEARRIALGGTAEHYTCAHCHVYIKPLDAQFVSIGPVCKDCFQRHIHTDGYVSQRNESFLDSAEVATDVAFTGLLIGELLAAMFEST